MAEVTFIYTVSVEDDQVIERDDGVWALKEEGKEAAYDMLMDGISDRSDNWFPRYTVLCLQSFMAGAVCDRAKGHDGAHGIGDPVAD